MFCVRNPTVGVILDRESVFVFDAHGAVDGISRPTGARLSPVNAVEISFALRKLAGPAPRSEVERLVGRDVLEALIELDLVWCGESEPELEERIRPKTQQPVCARIVVCVSAAVDSIHILPLLRDICRMASERVDVVLSPSAAHFVSVSGLQILGVRVWDDRSPSRSELPQIVESADVALVYPASAHTLYKIAHKQREDLLASVVLDAKCPVLVFASMNTMMWRNPAVQRNVARLRQLNYCFVEPLGSVRRVADRAGGPILLGGGCAVRDPIRLRWLLRQALDNNSLVAQAMRSRATYP